MYFFKQNIRKFKPITSSHPAHIYFFLSMSNFVFF